MIDCNKILNFHKLAQQIYSPDIANTALLSTLVSLAQKGNNEEVIYILRNLYSKEQKNETDIILEGLFKLLFDED